MEKYIGVKIVKAEQQERDGIPGYRVEYPDDHVSWSSKEEFEKEFFKLDWLGPLFLLENAKQACN